MTTKNVGRCAVYLRKGKRMESRENLAGKTLLEEDRLQYDGEDTKRIEKAAGDLARDVVELIGKIGAFAEETKTEIDEDSDRRMRYARQEVVEYWAFAQLALSKLAHVFRINGDEAFYKLIEFATSSNEEAALDMSGL